MTSPGFFITSFISAPIPTVQAPISVASQLEGVESGMHFPHPLSPGQKDSLPLPIPEGKAGEKTSAGAGFVEDLEAQQFDDAVASIYVSTPQDPFSYIREEKLEEKDIIMMDGKLRIIPSINRDKAFLPGLVRTSLDNYYWPLSVGLHTDLKSSPKPTSSDGPPKGTDSPS